MSDLEKDLLGQPNINKDFLFQESKNFCMLPWVHFHLWPDAKVFPCCISDSFYPIATYNGSLKEVWNSPGMRELRLKMLNDQPTSTCSRCYDLEKVGIHSLRKSSNESFGKHFDAVETTQADGTVDKIQLRYLDVRFSNLCNFKCRTCGPDLSSAWVDDHNAINGKLPWKVLRVGAELWDELKPLLNQVESAYFAGGEPIICDELYQILDHWIEIGHFDVSLGYTTNFSVLKYQGKNILDYWRKFPNTQISASIDDSGARAEYLRKGTQWKQIEANRRQMLDECPEVYFEITPTVGIYNVWHFPEFHREWIDKGLVELNNIRFNLVTKPDNLSVSVLPQATRFKLVDHWEKALDDLTVLAAREKKPIHNVIVGYQSAISMLKNEECGDTMESFWNYSNSLDEVRNEKILDIFPEFRGLEPQKPVVQA